MTPVIPVQPLSTRLCRILRGRKVISALVYILPLSTLQYVSITRQIYGRDGLRQVNVPRYTNNFDL